MELSKSGKPIRRGPYPELTLPAIFVGYILGTLIAVSIGYASLKLGFSIEGSELAAILGFGVLRGVMRRTSIVENNINQSLASSVNAASAGMMFSVPALFILNYQDFNAPLLVVGCITGAVMGIAFIIPLRKQMIDFERHPFPGGIAVATILKSPGAGMRKAYLLLAGAAVSAIVHAIVYQWIGYHDLPLGEYLGLPEFLNATWYVSLMTIGVGYLSGRGGVYFIIGGFVCYWLLAPIMSMNGLLDNPEIAASGMPIASWLRLQLFRPLGIGMLIGGALTGVALAFPLVVSAIRSMQQSSKTGSAVSRDELPIRMLYVGIAGAFVVLFVIANLSVPEMTLGRSLLMASLGTGWIWMAGVILSECIGRTNWSPLSGMTLIGITILLFIASGMSDRATVVSSIIVGAAMCVAMSQATDLMLDLKTGYLVGAIPRKQQIAQFLGTWLGPIVIMVLIFVLHNQSPLGGDEFPAPQGQALASMVDGITGGEVPTNKYLAGAGLGAALSASGIGGLGILVGLGFYLPFNIVLAYTIGTILRVGGDAIKGKSFGEQVGIPIAAGLIVGEALVGVGAAVVTIIGGMLAGGA
ncbi:MAG: OPT/YSL family transporter [Acidobacteriota bacterium]|nr:OPT/YSL family transporter [Acidobacteriota bacterium]